MAYNKVARWLIFISVITLAILLRMINLDKSLSGDEITSVWGARQGVKDIPAFVAKNDSYPPLQHYLLHFWLKLGKSDAWVRMLYVIFGIAICPVVYFAGKEYIGIRFGLLCMFFTAISAQLINLSQYARGIIISVFFISLSVFFMIKILKKESSFSLWLGYIFSSVLAVYSFYLSILIIVAENIALIPTLYRSRPLAKKWIISGLAIIILYLPWIPLFIGQVFHTNVANNFGAAARDKGFFVLGIHFGSLARFISGIFGLDQLFLGERALARDWPFILLLFIFIISTVIMAFIFLRAVRYFRKFSRVKALAGWAFPLLIIYPLIATIILRQAKNFPVMSRYAAPLTVFFIFILSAGVLSLSKKSHKAVIILCLAGITFLRLPAIYSSTEQWKDLVGYIEENSNPLDAVVLMERGKTDFKYYARLRIPRIKIDDFFSRDPKNSALISIDQGKTVQLLSLLKSSRDIWVVLAHANYFGGFSAIETWFLSHGFKKMDISHKFSGVEIARFRSPEGR